MKFGQLIECNMRNIFIEKLYTKFGRECRDVTNSWLDDKLPLAGFWLFVIEVILSKERIQNYSFFLISKNMKPRKM